MCGILMDESTAAFVIIGGTDQSVSYRAPEPCGHISISIFKCLRQSTGRAAKSEDCEPDEQSRPVTPRAIQAAANKRVFAQFFQ